MEPGDRCLVKKNVFGGKHKIQDKWEEEIYEVQERCTGNKVVYKVKPMSGGKARVLHRNQLLPLYRIPKRKMKLVEMKEKGTSQEPDAQNMETHAKESAEPEPIRMMTRSEANPKPRRSRRRRGKPKFFHDE